MTQQDVLDALNARLAAFPDLPDVAWEGIEYVVQDGVPYLSPRLSSYVSTGVGAGVLGNKQVDGTFTIVVRRAADEGRQPAGQFAAALVAWFSRGTAINVGGVPLILLQCSEQTASYMGNWVSVPVMVTFTALS